MSIIKLLFLKKRNGLLLLSSLLLGLTVPGIGLWPLVWVGMIPALLALTECERGRSAFFQGVLWGIGYHLFVFVWFLGLHPLAWMGFSTPASLAIAMGGWTVATVEEGLFVGLIWLGAFYLMRKKPRWGFLLGFPAWWVSGLWVLNLNSIGLPWGYLTYALASVGWIRQSAYGLSFWGLEYGVVLINTLLWWAYARHQDKALIWRPLAGAGGVLLLLLGTGWVVRPPHSDLLQRLNPVVVQANFSIEEERLWFSAKRRHVYYQALLKQVGADYGQQNRMIVLPEGVVDPELVSRQVMPFQMPSKKAMLLSGGLVRQQKKIYNAVLLLVPQDHGVAVATQFKRYLVPFGEKTPFIPEKLLQNMLGKWDIDYYTGFSAAPLDQGSMDWDGLHVGGLVCFEAGYPNLTWLYRRQGDNLLVTVSNLGWLHYHAFLEKQFLAMNQFRAAEAGIPLIVATNTGISAFISEKGAVLSRSQSGQTQLLTLRDRRTIQLKIRSAD